MSKPRERLVRILRTIDHELYKFSLGNTSGHHEIVSSIRWINQNLDQHAVLELIDTIYLTYPDVIKDLIRDQHFNPKVDA